MASAGFGDKVEGFHAVAAAIAAGRVTQLTVERGRLRHSEYADLVASAEEIGVAVGLVDDVRNHSVTTAPQGVVAAARPIAPVSLEHAVKATTPAALLVLDHLEDPRNVGAASRSALAAGVRSLVVGSRRSAALGAAAFKAAAGALEHMSVVSVGSIAETLTRLRKLGVWSVGLDGAGSDSLFGHHLLGEPVALVVGGEGSGLSRLVRERADALVRIPQVGDIESLNASVATSLAVYELARVRGWVI